MGIASHVEHMSMNTHENVGTVLVISDKLFLYYLSNKDWAIFHNFSNE